MSEKSVDPIPRILVVGFGAVGIIYSYLLEHHGKAQITAVARSKYDAILRDGITIQSTRWGKIESWKPSRVVRRIEDAYPFEFDYVFVCTKVVPGISSTPAILRLVIQQLPRSSPTFVLLQNGLGVEKELQEAIESQVESNATPSARPLIISCALYIMANVLENGTVIHVASDKVIAGAYRPDTNTSNAAQSQVVDSRISAFVDLLNSSGFEASSVKDIAAAKFNKNLWNASIGMVSCLVRLPPDQWVQDSKSSQLAYGLVKNMMEEIVAIGRSLGYDETYLPATVVEDKINAEFQRVSTTRTPQEFKASALLDITNNKPFELEVILGEVVRLGKQQGCSVTCLELVYNLLSIVQNRLIASYVASC